MLWSDPASCVTEDLDLVSASRIIAVKKAPDSFLQRRCKCMCSAELKW